MELITNYTCANVCFGEGGSQCYLVEGSSLDSNFKMELITNYQ